MHDPYTDARCDNLLTPVNGEIITCSSDGLGMSYEGDTCSFTCNTGYEIIGSDTRTCLNNGFWSGTNITCSRGRLLLDYNMQCHVNLL